MDYSYNLLEELQLQNNVPTTSFWHQPLLQRSDFVPFTLDQPRINPEVDCYRSSKQNKININTKIIEFLRRSSSCCPSNIENYRGKRENERCYKHKMGERMRRERQKDCYLALHSMLPMGTKKDKNSIVQIAAMEIQQLQSCKEELENKIMEAANYDCENIKEMKGTSKIRLKVANPTSGIDSMIEALKCFKQLGLKTKSIRSVFSPLEFSAELELELELETETKIGAAELEEAMQQTLIEAERKHLPHFQEHRLS